MAPRANQLKRRGPTVLRGQYVAEDAIVQGSVCYKTLSDIHVPSHTSSFVEGFLTQQGAFPLVFPQLTVERPLPNPE